MLKLLTKSSSRRTRLSLAVMPIKKMEVLPLGLEMIEAVLIGVVSSIVASTVFILALSRLGDMGRCLLGLKVSD